MNEGTLPRSTIPSGAVRIRPLLLKPQRMNGLSERLLVSHYENNYGGALRRLNAIQTCLADLDWSSTPGFEINGLKREELIAAGSVILHEVYFDSLGGEGNDAPTGLAQPAGMFAEALERDFGSVAAWRSEFTAMAKAQAGGSGCRIVSVASSTNGPPTTRTACQEASPFSRSICTSTPIISILAPMRAPMSIG
jgi:Fe-Mn family superoxide dismutase